MMRLLCSAVGLVVSAGCSSGPAPDPVVPLVGGMTLEQKAGQLFMGWILSRADGQAANREKLLAQVRAGVLGGVVLSTGTIGDARDLIRELQAATPRAMGPLLIAGDFESGMSMRLSDAPHLGKSMLLGASGSADLAYRVGRATGLEGAALGFDLCFAPVVDVNNNPDNPIINVRSLGEDPHAVARLGVALIRGLQENMIATAKHFPGHGDVTADSHLVLPTVTADRDRLAAVELVPFRAAVDAGVGAVMTAHLSVPALDPRPRLPATVSTPILTKLLRQDLGFTGIIVTDALEMGGVRKVMPGDKASVAALRAGADLLLMPPDPRAARDAVVRAVQSGAVSEQRLDEAVNRLLAAKTRAATRRPGPLAEAVWAEHRQLAREVARRGLTLVRDEAGLVPLERGANVVLLHVLDKDRVVGPELRAGLAAAGIDVTERSLHPRSSLDEIDATLAEARAAATLIVGLHVKVRAFSGVIGLPPALAGVVDVLQLHSRAIAVAFGNPYLVREFGAVKAYLCAFDQGPVVEAAVAAALTGKAPVTGRLPISIPDVAAVGDGISRFVVPSRGEFVVGDPRRQGMATDLPDRIRAMLEEHVAKRAFPGAVAVVTRRGQLLAKVAVGRETYAENAPRIATDTRYDLASLTKVCATLPAVAVLLDRGVLTLDDPLSKWVPGFRGDGKDAVTIRHVMVHSSGLPAYIRFFLNRLEGKQVIVDASARTALEYTPGSKKVYSDLGLILLMAAVEKASGKTLDRFLADDIYPKLGVKACFSQSGKPLPAAPTEDDAWRGRVVRGEVHDENAFAMGGVSGHAGLFGTAEDVARIGNAFLGGGGGLISGPLVCQLVQRDGMVSGSTRALLFDTFKKGGSGGHRLSPTAFGHTGFTGTSIWCDPRTDLCMVLLTNRVYPTRKNRKISAARHAFHDLVMGALSDG